MSKKPSILLIALVCSLVAFSQPTERGFKKKEDSSIVKGNTYAIIIGISDYKDVPDLKYAHLDALAFEKFLKSNGGGQVPNDNIEIFLNEKATKPNIGDAISIIARKAKPSDRIWFFFAGHGDMEDLTQIENGLLLLYNSPNGNYFGMNDDVLEILDLKRYLSPLAQRGVEMIFIVDACHSGNLKGGVDGVQQTASALAAAWGKEYKILSCQPNQLSLESLEWGGGRGLFSLELEEGMKGLGDANNDGFVTMFELQSYIQTNVSKYSEGRQIPLISGDLSKPIAKVDSALLVALKKEKASNYPLIAITNKKAGNSRIIDSLDEKAKKIYHQFQEYMAAKKWISPVDSNAMHSYYLFEKIHPQHSLLTDMRRELATSLNERFNSIAQPLLKGETSYATREECAYAAAELDSCSKLLGSSHYMFDNIRARKLFMDAMALTWAITDAEYNSSYKSTVQESIKLLEESEKLEPNAAYTSSALGVRYALLYDDEKATEAFQKYLSLRPNDFYAKFSLSLNYIHLKEYAKAKIITQELLDEFPTLVDLQKQLSDIYFLLNQPDTALSIIEKIINIPVTKGEGYFYKGIHFAKMNMPDSSIRYYHLAASQMGSCQICFNNIGHVFFVNNQLDSAKYYFHKVLEIDSTNPFANYNLGTIEVGEGEMRDGMTRFVKTSIYATAFTEGFLTHYQLYFNKQYPHATEVALNVFKTKPFIFNMQYLAYASIMYAYIRTPSLINNKTEIDFIFDQLFNYKQHEAFTWYHKACYLSLHNEPEAAIESLEKSLKAGYASLFTLKYDKDLNNVRTLHAFKTLLNKYFKKENIKF